jgi:hypothetical protein
MLIYDPPESLSMDVLPTKQELIEAYPVAVAKLPTQSPQAENKNHRGHTVHLVTENYRKLHLFATETMNEQDLTNILVAEGYMYQKSETGRGGYCPAEKSFDAEYCIRVTIGGSKRGWLYQWRSDFMATITEPYGMAALSDSAYHYLRTYFYYHDFAAAFEDRDRRSLAINALHQAKQELAKKVIIWGFTRKTTDEQNFARVNSWLRHAKENGFLRQHRLLKVSKEDALCNP